MSSGITNVLSLLDDRSRKLVCGPESPVAEAAYSVEARDWDWAIARQNDVNHCVNV